MALIICPECGQNVSSLAKACPHCGCKFIVCPECGNAHVLSADCCSECGYDFKKAVNQQVHSEKDNADMDKFKQRIDKNRTSLKTVKILYISILVLSVIALLLPVLIILIWSPQGNSYDLNQFKEMCNVITGLTVIGMVFLIVAASLKREGEGVIQIIFGIWLNKNNYDMVPYIKKPDGNNEFKQYLNSKDFNTVSSTAYISKIPRAGALLIVKSIIVVILMVISCIFFGQAMSILCNYAFMLKNYSNMNIIQIKDALVPFIVGAVIIVIANIFELIFNKVFQRKKESWFRDLDSKPDCE